MERRICAETDKRVGSRASFILLINQLIQALKHERPPLSFMSTRLLFIKTLANYHKEYRDKENGQ